MVDYLSRSAWNARPRRAHPGSMDPSRVVGLGFHWPATNTKFHSRDAVARALRSWQNYHMDSQGWSDIGYQIAIDQAGRAWYLRGLGQRSAANGGTIENGTHGAVLLVLAAGERPTPAMIQTIKEVVKDHRQIFSRSRLLQGHGEIRRSGPTECPGPIVRSLLKSGAFEPGSPVTPSKGSNPAPNTKEEKDMPLDRTDLDKIENRIKRMEIPIAGPIPAGQERGTERFQWAVARAKLHSINGSQAAQAALDQANRNRDAIEEIGAALENVAPGVAQKVLEKLGTKIEVRLSFSDDEDEEDL